jgi:hypothetical protein
MARRTLLVALLVFSTAAFVVGVSMERSSADTHPESGPASRGAETREGSAKHADEAGADEGDAEAAQAESAGDESESFLGLDYEAIPFVALAVAFSLAFAAAVWLRPRWALLLGVVAVAMLVFAALDVREVVHQIDESKGGLAVLAGVVAVCHLAAAALAALTGRSATPAGGGSLA